MPIKNLQKQITIALSLAATARSAGEPAVPAGDRRLTFASSAV